MHEITGNQKRLDRGDEHRNGDRQNHTVEFQVTGENGDDRSHQQCSPNGPIKAGMGTVIMVLGSTMIDGLSSRMGMIVRVYRRMN